MVRKKPLRKKSKPLNKSPFRFGLGDLVRYAMGPNRIDFGIGLVIKRKLTSKDHLRIYQIWWSDTPSQLNGLHYLESELEEEKG